MSKRRHQNPPKASAFKQAQSPWEDPDTSVCENSSPKPEAGCFDGMMAPHKTKKQPRFDMDSDLGA